MIYRHKKTNRIYEVLRFVVNATNAQNGQDMVLYRQFDLPEPISQVYVREKKEFEEKFEPTELKETA